MEGHYLTLFEFKKIIFQTELLISFFPDYRKAPRIRAGLSNYRQKFNNILVDVILVSLDATKEQSNICSLTWRTRNSPIERVAGVFLVMRNTNRTVREKRDLLGWQKVLKVLFYDKLSIWKSIFVNLRSFPGGPSQIIGEGQNFKH